MQRIFVFLSVLAISIAAFGAEKKVSGQGATDRNKASKVASPKTNASKAAVEKKSGGQAAGDKKAADLDLNGVWRGWVVEGKGQNPNRGSTHLELTIQGNQISAKRLDGEKAPLGQGVYTITTEKLYLMDAHETGARNKTKVYHGIVRFGPDLMKWCVATPGSKRPTDFETKGSQFLLILKRQRP